MNNTKAVDDEIVDSIFSVDEKKRKEVVVSFKNGLLSVLVSLWLDVDAKLKYKPSDRPKKRTKRIKADNKILERFVLRE